MTTMDHLNMAPNYKQNTHEQYLVNSVTINFGYGIKSA